MLWTSGKKNIAVIPKRGDRILSVIDSARLRDISIRDYMVNYNSALDFTVATAEDMAQKYEEFKVLNNLYDYTDMLIMAKNKNIETPPLDYLFIDEAQDLSRLQWILVDKMAATTKNIIIAGDDKQEINTFAAADIDTFLNIPGKIEVLKQSYRVPKRIYSKANTVMQKMTKYRKEGTEWLPKNEDGLVRKIKNIPFKAMQKGEWLFLTRTKYQAGRIAEKIMQNMEEGILVFNINGEAPFNTDIYRLIHIFNKINGSIPLYKRKALNGNPMLSMINIKDTDSVAIRKQKMDYIRLFKKYISCDTDKKLQPWEITEAFKEKLKEKNWLSAVDKLPFTIKRYVARTAKAYEEKGEELFTKANIRIMTIHAAKGREADNVVVLMDTPKVVQETIANAEDDTEVKVLYVALTRAKKQLCLLTEKPNRYSYEYYL